MHHVNPCTAPRSLLFIFSITRGSPADSVLEKIENELKEGDIVIDGGNEHYRNTERRQKRLAPKGVKWIGMGVSGGYQSARRGPSMSPGGEKEASKQYFRFFGNSRQRTLGPVSLASSTWAPLELDITSRWCTTALRTACCPPCASLESIAQVTRPLLRRNR